MTVAGLDQIRAELSKWQDLGQQPRFWLRDDDAVEPTAALDILLEIMGDAALLIAAIPAFSTVELAERLQDIKNVSVLQHGWQHENNALPGDKKSEFPETKPLDDRLMALKSGAEQIKEVFGPKAIPALVPPWNRAPDALLPHLPALGISGISRYRRTNFADRHKVAGILQIDTQIDIIDWRGTRGLRDPDDLYAEISEALSTVRAQVQINQTEVPPIGILTHHLVHDQACWRFLEELRTLTTSENGTWVNPFQTVTKEKPETLP